MLAINTHLIYIIVKDGYCYKDRRRQKCDDTLIVQNKIEIHTVPDRRNLTENAALNAFLKRSALRSLSVPLAFP